MATRRSTVEQGTGHDVAASLDAAQALQRALECHQSGQLATAQALYDQVLRSQPEHFDALHLSGLLASQTGDPGRAIQLIERAIAVDGRHAAAFCNLGSAWRELRRPDAALACYERALQLQPGFAQALSNRGNVLKELGRPDEALASYSDAIAADPRYAVAHANRGGLYVDRGELHAALADLDQALAIRPDMTEAWCRRGDALTLLGQHAAAIDSYDRALAMRAGYVAALAGRSQAQMGLGLHAAALASCDTALALQPDDVGAICNRGNVLQALGDPAAALRSYEAALQLNPAHAESLVNRGNLLRELGRLDEALASLDRAVALRPELPGAHFSRAVALLLAGNLRAGWPDYEWRWRDPASSASREWRDFGVPQWRGDESLQGRTLLLHAEQGLGDTLQFVRFAALAAARGAQVILEVPRQLVSLLASLDGCAQLVARGDRLPSFDLHCPLLSLPLAFATTLDTIPPPAPLRLDPASVAQWQDVLGPRSRPRVGLVWSGSAIHPNDRERSIALAEWSALLPDHLDYVCLQHEVRERDRAALAHQPAIRYFGEQLRDFCANAALCACMDLVISVDTSLAHLSATLGRPTWILLPHDPDWRWLLHRADTPWYPAATLHRQPGPGQWRATLGEIRNRLVREFPRAAAPPHSARTDDVART